MVERYFGEQVIQWPNMEKDEYENTPDYERLRDMRKLPLY